MSGLGSSLYAPVVGIAIGVLIFGICICIVLCCTAQRSTVVEQGELQYYSPACQLYSTSIIIVFQPGQQ